MLEEQTIHQLKELRLHGMVQAAERLQESVELQTLPVFEVFAFLIEAERHYREENRLKRFKREAKLKFSDACLENIKYNDGRGIDKAQIRALSNCRWVVNNQHLIILGATGAGKTYLANAFANQAIHLKHKVVYKRVSRLLEEMKAASAVGELPEFRLKLSKIPVLILDDWGLGPINALDRQHLLEVLEDKTGSGAVIITSQLPIAEWHNWLNDPTLADAILDRLVHRAHTIKLKGESMRKVLGLNEEK
ncbi:MAG: ATP-binding protein [Gammaproteobacteria bacterium]|nr:ATP-binding protein [Gammaproteobacteria bacterium]